MWKTMGIFMSEPPLHIWRYKAMRYDCIGTDKETEVANMQMTFSTSFLTAPTFPLPAAIYAFKKIACGAGSIEVMVRQAAD